MIELDFEFNLPNQHCVDHSQSEGKTRTATYDGPDKIFLIVNNNTGKEEMGPITETEKSDGRPVPEDCRYVEVDCITNPLVCQLRAPVIDEMEEDYTGLEHPPGVVDIPGFMKFHYQVPLRPQDVYDPLDITVDENDNIHLTKRSLSWAIMGVDGEARLPNWDDVRNKRMQLIKNSDSEITDDMPEDLRAKWMDYRQRLRDWPGLMQEAGVPPEFAYNMEPIDPASEVEALNGGDLYDI